MRLQKSRSYLINDWLCNCRFEARRAPPSAMGFLDIFGASGLMWKRRACHGTQCLIHQLPPAQSRGSIPAPTPGPLPRGPGLGTTLPGLCSLRSSPKMLAFPPPVLGSQRGSFRGPLRGQAGGPCVLSPPLASPSPTAAPAPSRLPRAGAHGPPAGATALAPSVSESPSCFRSLLPLVGTLNVSPSGVHLSSGLGLVTPSVLPNTCSCVCPPPTRCLGGLCPLRDPGAQDATPWS